MPDDFADLAEQARGLVRAVRHEERRGDRVEYHVYRVRVGGVPSGLVLAGERTSIQDDPPVVPRGRAKVWWSAVRRAVPARSAPSANR